MIDHYAEIFQRYRHKGLLVDTNLLLLLVVGAYDPNRIKIFKRTKQFAIADYELLLRITRGFKNVITTPSILTEASNLLGQLSAELSHRFFRAFSSAIGALAEEYTQRAELAKQPYFAKYGLTDASIIHCVKGKYLVITVDFPLWGFLRHLGVDAVNFNHLRTKRWTP